MGCSIFYEDLCAFVGGGSRGKNIIEQNDAFVLDAGFEPGGDIEGTAQICQSFRSAEAGLCLCVPIAFKCVDRSELAVFSEAFGNFF